MNGTVVITEILQFGEDPSAVTLNVMIVVGKT